MIDLTKSVGRRVWVYYAAADEPEIEYDVDTCPKCGESLPKQPVDPDHRSVSEILWEQDGIVTEMIEWEGNEMVTTTLTGPEAGKQVRVRPPTDQAAPAAEGV